MRLGCVARLVCGLLLVAPPLSARADAGLLDELMMAQAAMPGDTGRVPVYLRLDTGGYWPRRLHYRVDRQDGQRLDFSPAQAEVLKDRALMYLAQVPLNAHRVEFELWLGRESDPAAEAGVVYRYTLLRPELHRATTIMVEFRRSLWRAWRPGLKARTLDALSTAQQEAVAATDLAIGRAVPAGLRLRRLQHAGRLSPAGQLLLGDVQARLGLHPESIWRELTTAGSPPVAARAALRLAERGWARQEREAAARWLPAHGDDLPVAERARYQALRIALDIEDAALLPDAALQQGAVALAAYNQALRRGRLPAELLLERIGGLGMLDDLAWAVRDQVNLALGYAYLRRRLPERAHDAFARVRAQGAQASAGRLGLGWAQITPAGGDSYAQPADPRPQLRPHGDQAWAEARRSTPLRTAAGVAQGHQAEQLRRALVPWTDLIGADPLDPAVQEAMLAIPYALGHLGAHEDAAGRWQDAIARLSRLQQAITQAGQGLDQARLARWLPGPESGLASAVAGSRWWRQTDWPDDFLVARLLQVPGVQRQLLSCQVWEQVGAQPGMDQLPASLHRRLAEAQRDCRQALLAQARRMVAAWQAGVAAYLSEAHLALARLHDAAPRLITRRAGS